LTPKSHFPSLPTNDYLAHTKTVRIRTGVKVDRSSVPSALDISNMRSVPLLKCDLQMEP